MKYPLDQLTFNETITHVVSHANMQTVLIDKLSELLGSAMDASEHDDDDWYKESSLLLQDLNKLKMDHDTRRWNETNIKAQVESGALRPPTRNLPVQRPRTVKHLAEQPEIQVAEKINDPNEHIVGLPGIQFDDIMNAKANEIEKDFGGELTEEELERRFNQKRTKIKKVETKKLSDMSLEEIEDWERKQDNGTDIYKISARVKNLARGGNASLTEQGEMLCNTYTHVVKAFYDFAEKIDDKNTKIQLIQLIRSHENMPGNLIAAAGAGVKRQGPKK